MAQPQTAAPLPQVRNRFIWISALYGTATIALSYRAVYLQQSGFTAAQIGVIMAAVNLMGIFSQPIWGLAADRWRSFRKALCLCALVGGALLALVPAAASTLLGPVALVGLLLPLANFFTAPGNALLDSWLVTAAHADRRLNFPAIRSASSLSYGVISCLVIVLIHYASVASTFYLFIALCIPMALLASTMPEVRSPAGRQPSLRDLHPGRLFTNFHYVLFLLFSMAANICLLCGGTFLPYLIEEVGGNSDNVGLIYGLRALCEILPMLLSARLTRRFPLPVLLAAAGVLYGLELFGLAACGSFTQIILLHMVEGLAYGLFHVVGVQYIFRLVPEALSATAQTLQGALLGVCGILGNLAGGAALDSIGARGLFLAFGLVLSGTLTAFVLSFLLGRRIHRPLPPQAWRL